MIRPVLLVVIPLLLAFISVMFKKVSRELLILAAIVNVVIVFLIERGSYYIGGYKPPYGIVLKVDNYSLYGLMVLNLLFFLLIVMNLSKIKNMGSILMIALGSLNGLLMTNDLFNLFVFMEISTIAAFIIIATNKKYLHLFNYMVIAIVGSSLYLFGLILLYSQYGTLNMEKMNLIMVNGGTPGSYIPIILIFSGLAVETKLLPFNGWVKGVLKHGDSLVGPMIASIYSGVMLLVFGRLFSDVFILDSQVTLLLSIIAVVTLFGGEFAAFSTMKLKEILLYSSIAQSGLAVLLFLNGYGSIAILVVLGNVLAKFVLFLLAGIMVEGMDTDDVEQMGGIFKKNPMNGITFTVAILSLVGLPAFFGFFIKMNILYNVFMQGDYVLPAIILLTSLIEGGYMIRLLVKLWNPGKEGEKSTNDMVTTLNYPISSYVCVIALFIAFSLVVLGLSPDLAIQKANEAGSDLSQNISEYTISLEGGEE